MHILNTLPLPDDVNGSLTKHCIYFKLLIKENQNQTFCG